MGGYRWTSKADWPKHGQIRSASLVTAGPAFYPWRKDLSTTSSRLAQFVRACWYPCVN